MTLAEYGKGKGNKGHRGPSCAVGSGGDEHSGYGGGSESDGSDKNLTNGAPGVKGTRLEGPTRHDFAARGIPGTRMNRSRV